MKIPKTKMVSAIKGKLEHIKFDLKDMKLAFDTKNMKLAITPKTKITHVLTGKEIN